MEKLAVCHITLRGGLISLNNVRYLAIEPSKKLQKFAENIFFAPGAKSEYGEE